MATIDPVILQLRADVDNYVSDIRQSTAAVEQSLGRQEVAVVRHGQTFVRSNAAAQQSMRNLGFQISDIGTQLAAGSSPFLVLAQQGPQVANALEGTAGVAGRLAAFFSGPWGAALLAAGSVVGVLAGKLWDSKAAGEAAAEGYDAAAAAANRLKTITDSIRAGKVDNQAVGEARLTVEGLQAERNRIAGLLKGGPGEAEGRGRLAVLDAQIAEAQLIIRAADVAKRNQERLAGLGNAPTGPTLAPTPTGSSRRVVDDGERELRALENSLSKIKAQALALNDSSADEAAAQIIAGARNRFEVEREVNGAIAEDEARLREDNVRSLASLYENLLTGGTKNIWSTFKQIGIRVIAETLATFSLGGGSGGAGGFLGSLVKGFSAAFSGGTAPTGRASGGYVAPGQTVRVNEQRGGVELLRMGSQGGTVIPLGQVNQSAYRGGAGGGVATVRLELSGDIDARIQSVSAGVAVEVVRGAAPTIIDASARETAARLSRPRI